MNDTASSPLALVTGASRGIGYAIATTLAHRGFRVIGTSTTEEGAHWLNEDLEKLGGEGWLLDITDASQVEATLRRLAAEGGLSVLVNNAGVTHDGLLMRMSDEQWQRVLDTNLTAVFRLCRGVVRGMMKRRSGRIITVGSIVGSTGNAGQANYAASKAAAVAFSKSLAMEVGGRGITVNVVAPGCIETDMTKNLPADVRAAAIAHTPLGRVGTPQEVADAVAFLASSAASFITGETLHVNGGMHMF
jgi:3-oxoacyl-[acyl-carrier protein] reductase